MQVNTRETAEGVSHFLRSAGLRNSGFVYICRGGGSGVGNAHWLLLKGGITGKESTCQCRGRHKGRGFDLRVEKILWRRKLLPTSVFLPEKFYRQRSLVGYSPWSRKELDMTEHSTDKHCFVVQSLSHDWLQSHGLQIPGVPVLHYLPEFAHSRALSW